MRNWGEIESRLDPSVFKKGFYYKSNCYHMKKLGEVIEINPSTNFSSIKEDDYISFVPMEEIDEKNGKVKSLLHKKAKERKGFTKFQNGDLLWAKITPCMQNAKSTVVYDLENGLGCGSTEFYILRPKNNSVIIEYILFILREKRILESAQNFFGGSAGQQRVAKQFLTTLKIPVPPTQIQQQIVDIMDNAYAQKQAKEKEAAQLLDSINTYLLDELGIKMPLEEENTLNNRKFYVSSSNVIGNRFDPRKYTVKYQKLFQAIKNAPFNKLHLRDIITDSISGNWGLDETEDDETLISCLTIRATEFDNKYNLNLDNSRTKFRKYKPVSFEKMVLTANDILVEKSGGSEDQPVGRVAFIEENLLENNFLAYSNFIHKIVINNNFAYSRFVFEYLRLMHNIKVTEVMQTQTNGIRNLIMGEYLNQLVILPKIDAQKVIAETASDMRNRAKALQAEAEAILEKAKKEVEMILLGDENGGIQCPK